MHRTITAAIYGCDQGSARRVAICASVPVGLLKKRAFLPRGAGICRGRLQAEAPMSMDSEEPATGRGAYGASLASRFGLEAAPSFVFRTLPASEVAVTELRCD